MTNKKSKEEGFGRVFWTCIILLILAVIVLVYAGVRLASEPHFKITKEECYEKTRAINYKYKFNLSVKKEDLVSLNEELLYYRIFKKGQEEGEFERYGECEPNKFTRISIISEDYEEVIYSGFLKVSCYEDEQVCSPVEVDEDESLCWNYNEGGLLNLCREWMYKSIARIEKIDLSLNWLEENCDMILNRKDENSDIGLSINSFKCGDYTIEVSK